MLLARETEGKCMKNARIAVRLLVGLACGVSAQEGNAEQGRTNAGASFSESSASQVTLFSTSNAANFALPSPVSEASEVPAPAPLPAAPTPRPKYVVFGDRDDYRWQLGVALEYFRFRSNIYDASMLGLNTSLTYFTNSWFAFEGDIVTGFAPPIYQNDYVKLFGGSGGIRIGGRKARWEPFGHALVGGSHLQPQTAAGGRTSLLAQAGLGMDFRVHARLSLRLEGDWVYTQYFNQTQNNFQGVAGVVFHF